MTKENNIILVVDDERVNLMVMMKLLAKVSDHCQIISAPNGVIACNLALKKQPDIIIMDWEMPEMNGIEALKKLKADPKTVNIPVIMATAVRTSNSNLSEALDAGAVDYLRKPIEETELLARVRSALKLSNSLKTVQDQHQQISAQAEQLQAKNNELTNLIGELKNSNKQLTQSEKLATVGMLTAGIAHEINNPVNFIRNGMDSLTILVEELFSLLDQYHAIDLSHVAHQIKGLDKLAQIKEDIEYDTLRTDLPEVVDHIKEGANRAFEIARVMKNFSRKDGIKMEFMNLHDGLEGTLILLNHHLKDRIHIEKNFDVNLPAVYCFPTQLNQVFMNLIHNAIQAIENKGEIIISTSQQEGHIVASIQDDGIGMDEEVQKKLFEPFFTTKEQNQGTGLGMSITQNIIEKHKGIIQVESEKGKGTTFTVKLPIVENED